MHRYLHRLLLLLIAFCSFGFGQVAYQLSPVAHQQFFDANGKPLAGGFIYTYSAGSTTPLATFKDNAGTANTNPIVLDAGGFATIYLGQNSYKFVAQNSSAVQQWSQDNVQNISQVLLTTANTWTLGQTFNSLINFLGGTSDTTAAEGNVFYRTDLHRIRWYDSGAAAWHSVVGADSTDTLTNKTLTSPTVNSPTIATPTITGNATESGITAPLTQTIASGMTALGVALISSNSCATAVTAAGSGILTTDTITWSFNADPNSITGYTSGTTGPLVVYGFPTANNANFRVCNLTGGSITPGAASVNWRVMR